ncbi:hypothetical protein MSG28_014966 [Choristoneura fumiferana]|uniref:Uncharacterized protein n=1 Tax=Choristoneura fumiferana TaxID=7141 RepID=A0ACC0KXS1_CHOFU|nr:hypothetical protein MSG28_014966 [Choristoneura fumiferana]
MAPYAAEREVPLEGYSKEVTFPKLVAPQADDHKFRISWFNVFAFGYWHGSALYGLYLGITSASWPTIIYAFIMMELSVLGITAACHRLYAHKTFKVKLPLNIIMMILATFSGQYTVYNWVRDHRLHHKCSDTDGDPHNATRGFFFSHIGWILCEKHPEVKRRGVTIDMSDIKDNPVLAFQKKYAAIWFTMVNYVLPTYFPMYFWGETLSNAWHLNSFRFVMSLNIICLVNSAAHMWGNRPYDETIRPANNDLTIVLTLGEGFHNYHHAFPWDYRSAEFGNETFNFTTTFIHFFKWLGWAYDFKTVDREMILKRVARTGNGTHASVKEVGGKNDVKAN